MRIIISPAKKMNVDVDSLPYNNIPYFLNETSLIMQTMQGLSDAELKKLW